MAYNEYDDPHFFEEYAKMGRSQGGLPAAGECCKYAAEQGAAEVLGIDLSHRMIAEAEQRNADSRITYRVCGIEDYEYPAERWDCVVSNLALHYIADLDAIYRKVRHTLRPGGVFLFNIEHPVFTARPGQDWIYDEAGQPLYWPVDDYFMPGERLTHFLGCEVKKQHHTLTQILMGLRTSGFAIDAVEEAQPSQEMLDLPGMRDELRRPMMLLVKAVAQKE